MTGISRLPGIAISLALGEAAFESVGLANANLQIHEVHLELNKTVCNIINTIIESTDSTVSNMKCLAGMGLVALTFGTSNKNVKMALIFAAFIVSENL